MAGVHPEPFREHIVQLRETVFPPKQVLAVVTGWDRLSFTTMEAQRVLSKLGFVCQRAGTLDDGRGAWLAVEGEAAADRSLDQRIALVEAGLATAQVAIAGLHARLRELENRGSSAS